MVALGRTFIDVRQNRPPMEGKLLTWKMPDQDGKTISSKDLKGTPYVLYFYPKDDTPGCTKEACSIRDVWSDFEKAGLKVFGVSKDDAAKHQKFIAKYELPFTLLTATEAELDKLGVWKEKNLYGRKYMGIMRETYLVNAEGKVAKHYPKVQVAEHGETLLTDFAAL
jgi:peroxiredoxin Q/BCP